MKPTILDMPKPKKEPTDTVRLRTELLRRAARIAAHKDVSVPDYLASILEPLIDADEEQMLRDLQEERGVKPCDGRPHGKKKAE